MSFVRGQPVQWKGEPCVVVAVSGLTVALERVSDRYTVITSESALESHQKVGAKVPKQGAS